MNSLFFQQFCGAVLLLIVTGWISNKGLDVIVAWWNRRHPDQNERRRLQAVMGRRV